MIVRYQKKMSGTDPWEDVGSLDEIPVEAWPHVFALDDLQVFECPEPIEFIGVQFRAVQDSYSQPYNPLIAALCLRLQQAGLDKEYWKEQVGSVAERDAQFKKVAGRRRDEIQKALVVVMTKLADAFEGSHNERHAKIGRAMTQLYEVSALCEKIPDLLMDTANDISF